MGKKSKLLSERVRPNSEAAPWVVEEIKRLEQENLSLRSSLEEISTAFGLTAYSPELWAVILMDKARRALKGSS